MVVGFLLLFLAIPLTVSFLNNKQEGRSQAAGGPLPWLKTSGNQIVSADTNQPVVLRGANVLVSEWEGTMDWDSQAIPELAKWGGNVILRGYASEPVNNNDATYLDILDGHVSVAQANNMYIIFAFRSSVIDGAQPAQPDNAATQSLVALATRYKDKPNVMYALQAEPGRVPWSELRPQFESMVDAIRAATAPNVPIIFIPGTDGSHDVTGAITDPVKRENVVYKIHEYGHSDEYQERIGSVYDAGLPVFIGEFGPSAAEVSTMADMPAFFQFTRDRGIGWAAWFLTSTATDGGESLMNADLSPQSPWGVAVKNELGVPPGVSTPGNPTQPITPTTYCMSGEPCTTNGPTQAEDRDKMDRSDQHDASNSGKHDDKDKNYHNRHKNPHVGNGGLIRQLLQLIQQLINLLGMK